MEEIVGICVVSVMLAAMLAFGAAHQSLCLLPVTSTGITLLVDAIPAFVHHRLGVVFAVALWKSESATSVHVYTDNDKNLLSLLSAPHRVKLTKINKLPLSIINLSSFYTLICLQYYYLVY